MRILAVIVAAGRGNRFGTGDVPKQWATLCDRPMLAWSIDVLAAHPRIDGVVVALAPGGESAARGYLGEMRADCVERFVDGGETRQQSVSNAIEAMSEMASVSTHVLIHDAARPCLSPEIVDRLVDALVDERAVVPVVPIADTLVRTREDRIEAVVDRADISQVQTPQAFEFETILAAHRRAASKGLTSSDDGSLVLAMGESVATVPGESSNLKVTYPNDLDTAAAVLAARSCSNRGER